MSISCLEYDYIKGDTLSDYFKKNNKNSNKNFKNNFIKIIDNIFIGNEFLNKNNIKRSDNHNNNIIITKDLNIKYIDFGRSFIVDTNDKQLDYKFFELLIDYSYITLEFNNDNLQISEKKEILTKLIKEFSNKLGLV